MCYRNNFLFNCRHRALDPTLHVCDLAGKDVFPNRHCDKHYRVRFLASALPRDCTDCERTKAEEEEGRRRRAAKGVDEVDHEVAGTTIGVVGEQSLDAKTMGGESQNTAHDAFGAVPNVAERTSGKVWQADIMKTKLASLNHDEDITDLDLNEDNADTTDTGEDIEIADDGSQSEVLHRALAQNTPPIAPFPGQQQIWRQTIVVTLPSDSEVARSLAVDVDEALDMGHDLDRESHAVRRLGSMASQDRAVSIVYRRLSPQKGLADEQRDATDRKIPHSAQTSTANDYNLEFPPLRQSSEGGASKL